MSWQKEKRKKLPEAVYQENSEQVCLTGSIEFSLGKCDRIPQSPLTHEKHRFAMPPVSSPTSFNMVKLPVTQILVHPYSLHKIITTQQDTGVIHPDMSKCLNLAPICLCTEFFSVTTVFYKVILLAQLFNASFQEDAKQIAMSMLLLMHIAI